MLRRRARARARRAPARRPVRRRRRRRARGRARRGARPITSSTSSAAGIAALAAAGVRAVLLPVASFTLAAGIRRPSPRCARRASRSSSRATRTRAPRRPRACPSRWRSRCARTGSRVAEAILGATREAAASLGLAGDVGVLAPGMAADLVALGSAARERARAAVGFVADDVRL